MAQRMPQVCGLLAGLTLTPECTLLCSCGGVSTAKPKMVQSSEGPLKNLERTFPRHFEAFGPILALES